MLDGDQLEQILMAAARGQPCPIEGEEAKRVYDQTLAEIEETRAQGGIISLPSF